MWRFQAQGLAYSRYSNRPTFKPGAVPHICNPSYWGGWGGRIMSSRPIAWETQRDPKFERQAYSTSAFSKRLLVLKIQPFVSISFYRNLLYEPLLLSDPFQQNLSCLSWAWWCPLVIRATQETKEDHIPRPAPGKNSRPYLKKKPNTKNKRPGV
jgi:hypothetical protein